MKRMLAILLTALMLVMLLPTSANAETGLGELEIVSEPETIVGNVGEIVKVNFYLYPNLQENVLMGSMQGLLQYDSEMLTFGAINTKDEADNLRSFLEDGKSTMKIVNSGVPGKLQFAFIDAYGWSGQGFWIQVEFRIDKEGASALVFNGIQYTGIDQDTQKSVSYYIEPKQAGAITTGGEDVEVPTDAAAEVTYEPLTPEIEESKTNTATATPKPHNDGQSVPVTSALPTPDGAVVQQSDGTPSLVTLPPAVTSMPMTTKAPQAPTQATDAAGTDNTNDPGMTAPESQDTPIDQPGTESSDQPVTPVSEGQTAEQQPNGDATDVQTPGGAEKPLTGTEGQPSNLALTVAVIAGIAVVILLAVLAIILILVRKKRMDAAEEEDE